LGEIGEFVWYLAVSEGKARKRNPTLALESSPKVKSAKDLTKKGEGVRK